MGAVADAFTAPGGTRLRAMWLRMGGSDRPLRVMPIHRERLLYGTVLPACRLRHAALLGWTSDNLDGAPEGAAPTHWQFLEDVGEERHDSTVTAEAARLARWLGTLAACPGARQAAGDEVPVHRPAAYEAFLHQASGGLPAAAEERALCPATLPGLTADTAPHMADLGRVLYLVKLLAQSVPTFAQGPEHRVGGMLRVYQPVLSGTLTDLGWR